MTAILTLPTLKPGLVRFLRFLAVGLLGTLIDFGLLTVLKSAGFPTLAANSLSFTAGIVNNYILNQRWTFAGCRKASSWGLFIQFSLVSLLGLLLNNGIVLILEGPLGKLLDAPAWGYLPAKAAATGLVVFWNYFANRYWTFRQP